MAINISYTLISQVLYNGNVIDHCPRRVYWEYLSPVKFKDETDPMIEGQFFETLAIGSGRDGAAVTDLRRNQKTGEKRVIQERIEYQAIEFKRIARQKEMKIHNDKNFSNVQWPIRMRWEKDPEIIIEIHPDIVLTPYTIKTDNENISVLATVDTKLTGNLSNDWGKFQWADISKKDLLQAHLYTYVIMNFDKEWNKQLEPDLPWDDLFNDQVMNLLNPQSYVFVYAIFESAKTLNHKFHIETYKEINIKQMHESIRMAIEIYRRMARDGYPANPSFELCKNCPIRNKCNEANNNESIN
jgi:hypothetical protein